MDTTSAHEELLYIRKVIDDSRASFAEDGKPYIAWGIIVSLGMLATYFENYFNTSVKFSGWLWIGLSVIGIAYVFYEKRRASQKRATNFADRLQGVVWGAAGSTIGLLLLLIFISYSNNPDESIHPIFGCSLASFILAIAYSISGAILELKWLQRVAYAWWAGAVGLYFVYSVHALLIYALMIIFFQVVPGIVLFRNSKKLHNSISTQPKLVIE